MTFATSSNLITYDRSFESVEISFSFVFQKPYQQLRKFEIKCAPTITNSNYILGDIILIEQIQFILL